MVAADELGRALRPPVERLGPCCVVEGAAAVEEEQRAPWAKVRVWVRVCKPKQASPSRHPGARVRVWKSSGHGGVRSTLFTPAPRPPGSGFRV